MDSIRKKPRRNPPQSKKYSQITNKKLWYLRKL